MQKNRGFTLIEMSIVLVIIGLIISGILMGQDLIQHARQRKIMSDIEQLKTAAYTFKAKYGSIPGDIPNAGDYWPLKNHLDPTSCWVGAASPNTTNTCNGDGDGIISGYENYFFFNHLSLANLIPGTYGNSAGGQGWNTMSNNDYNATYGIFNLNGSEWQWFNIKAGNNFFFCANGCNFNLPGALPYNELVQIDIKFDDGNVVTGNIRRPGALGTSCTVTPVMCNFVVSNSGI